MPDKEWAKMHRKTIGCIRQCIEVSVFHHVSQETKADTLWKKLESLYERKTAQNKAFAIRKLAHLKLKEGRSVAEHLSEFQDLVNQLTRMNLVVDDKLQALLLLSSLPDSWETLVVSLSNSAPNGVLQLAMVKDSLFNEETRRKDMGKDDAQALVTENRGRSKGRNSKGRGEDECCHVADPYDEWVIDSAASYHVTPRREFFTSYKAGNLGRVKMGNKSYADIVRIGDICVETNTGYTLKLKDVRHIPDMRLNLISVSVLDKEGYESHLGNGKWKLFKGSLVFARGKICCTLYKTQVKLCRDVVNAAQDDSMPDLWHRRLAHMSEKGLQILAKKSLIPFAKGMPLNSCDYCLFGKQHRVSFRRSSTRKSNVLDLVYSDVCGPIEVESLGGNRYFVTFIDDASRKVWVYVLKTKDQVFQLFKKFHAMVEREKGKSLKCLRTDNGGEYTSNEFENYCSEYGIRHEKTVPGTPQHNGVAERINRTIVEKVRCMLRMAKLPKSFWAEAVQTACYLINRSPSVPLDFDIPERVWTGEDASYAHLKVFGCKTFAHVPKEQRLKLDDKATPCIFVGYGDAEFGYKLWDPKKKKMIRSISDLTPTSSSSDITTDIEEVQVENYGDEPAEVDGDDAIDTEGVEQEGAAHSTRDGRTSASLDLELEQMDVKTAFLHGDLEEEIYMVQPEGFEAKGKEHKVCRLKKSLYGLKQAPRQWYKKFDSFMVGQGYTRTDADHCMYVKQFPNGKFIILLLYVDDMLIVGQDANMVGSLKKELFKSFDMKDLGPARQILGMQILRDRKAKKLWLSQEKYVERVLERFNMKHAKPVSTPLGGHFKLSKKSCPSSNKEKENMESIPYSSAVGSSMYAMVCTRLDITHAVGVVSSFMVNPGKEHWEAVKWIFRYLRGSSKSCLSFGSSKPVLEGYTDADMAGDLDGRKSTSGFLFTFAGGAVSWQSKLQKCVALSTTEAEYIAATEAGKEMLWMKRFLQDLGLKQDEYVVHCDSQSALDLSKNSTYHSRTKHIDVRYHWLRLIVDQQLMQLRKIHTDKNPADMLTKVVPKEKLELCAGSAGMNSN
uniref:Integrase catalytic domain-containing protein n=1 Tax=Fagus sylvatica TaxID=28930 RepID=A0A2N9EW40_FAGSY